MTIERLSTDSRMSLIVTHNGTVYLSGEVANDLKAGVEQQTRETLANIERLLLQAGSDKTRVLSATIYLKDIEADFAGMNSAWDQWLPAGSAPARATVQARMCDPDFRVEISVIAALADAAGCVTNDH